MATAKQLAARKLFAARAKAGLLQGNKKKRAKKTAEHYERPGLISKVEAAEAALRIAKKHAARKANPAKKKAISRPSQATGKRPTKRLVDRRRANTVPGTFPNPVHHAARSVDRFPRPGEYEVYVAKYQQSHMNHHDPAQMKLGALIARFPSRKHASEYAKAYADAHGKRVIVVGHQ